MLVDPFDQDRLVRDHLVLESRVRHEQSGAGDDRHRDPSGDDRVICPDGWVGALGTGR